VRALLLTKPNVESRDKCLFLIARDLVRDIRTLQRKAKGPALNGWLWTSEVRIYRTPALNRWQLFFGRTSRINSIQQSKLLKRRKRKRTKSLSDLITTKTNNLDVNIWWSKQLHLPKTATPETEKWIKS